MAAELAERILAQKRIGLRITLLGSERSGKTSLISTFVNNVFYEKYTPTEHEALYYITYSKGEVEDSKNAPKFNTLLEIEDTPASEKLGKQINCFYDIYWPKTSEMAHRKIPADKVDPKTKEMRSVNLPFSALFAPVGKYNDEDRKVTRDEGEWQGKHFCGYHDMDKRFLDKRCTPDTPGGNCWVLEKRIINQALGQKPPPGHQCMSCIRFDGAVKPPGEFRPLVRQRMAYLFVFDATKKASYLEAIKRFQEFKDFLEKQKEISVKPVMYLVGNKDDLKNMVPEGDSPEEKNDYLLVNKHLSSFISEQSESGISVGKAFVSAMQHKGVAKLFRSVVADLRDREPLWKVDVQGASDDPSQEGGGGCGLQ